MRALLCLVLGHVRTEWAPVVDVDETYTWDHIVTITSTTNAVSEVRFCLRCHSGYQRRFAR